MGSQAEQSTLMLCYWCLELASDCEILLGTTAMIKEPVELAVGGGDGYCWWREWYLLMSHFAIFLMVKVIKPLHIFKKIRKKKVGSHHQAISLNSIYRDAPMIFSRF